MLQVKDLTITHRRDLRVLVEGLSFVLNPGDKAAVIGEEGNGKSTVLKWIFDPALVEGYCQCRGELINRGHVIGYLAQELSEEEKSLTVYEYCAACPGFQELDYRELGGISRQLRLDVDLYYSGQEVGGLSGGERIKLQLSRLLFARPDVLLLDEPSSDVDMETLGWLEGFIAGFHGSILYISHDEALLGNTANCVLHIEHPREGKPPRAVFARMGYGEYVSRRSNAIANQAQQARKEREEYGKKMEKFRRIQQAVEHAQAAITRADPAGGRLLKKKMHAVQSMGRRFEREAQEMTQLPQVEEEIFLRFAPEAAVPAGKVVLDFALDELRAGEKILSKGVRLHVCGGEKVGIIGPNGAGKTTLLRLIASSLLARRDIRAAYMPQDYTDTLPLGRTPIEYLAPGGHRDDETRARAFLGSLRYAREEMAHPIGGLSGGQKAKLLLAKMMLDKNDVLVLDEPTRNFSPLSGPHIRAALSGYGGSIITVSHDRKYLAEVCTAVYRLTPGGLEPASDLE